MKKNKLVGAIVTGVFAVGAAFGIAALCKGGKNEECDCEADCEEDETCEETDSEE